MIAFSLPWNVIDTGATLAFTCTAGLYGPVNVIPLPNCHQFAEKLCTFVDGVVFVPRYQIGWPLSSYMYPAMKSSPPCHSRKKPRPLSLGLNHQPPSGWL